MVQIYLESYSKIYHFYNCKICWHAKTLSIATDCYTSVDGVMLVNLYNYHTNNKTFRFPLHTRCWCPPDTLPLSNKNGFNTPPVLTFRVCHSLHYDTTPFVASTHYDFIYTYTVYECVWANSDLMNVTCMLVHISVGLWRNSGCFWHMRSLPNKRSV